MQTPIGELFSEWVEKRRVWLDTECVSSPDARGVILHKCGTRLKAGDVYLAVHDAKLDGCVPSGETFHTAVPYCPACEEKPAETGCVHV